MNDLAREFRPTRFEDVIGQIGVVQLLKTKLASKSLPHAILFRGPTGVGKTTIARILAKELGCENNLIEQNCADVRGIDAIREMQRDMRTLPMGEPCKVYILDEVVQLPKATQQASLKVFEDLPNHVYILVCTSDTTDLLPSFLGRFLPITLSPLSDADIKKIVLSAVAKLSPGGIDNAVLIALISKAEGNARKALNLLEMVLSASSEEEQLKLLGLSSLKDEEKIEFLATAIFKKEKWKQIIRIIDSIEERDVETIRRQILDYACKIMATPLITEKTYLANAMIEYFRDSWAECGKAGLYSACFQLLKKRG